MIDYLELYRQEADALWDAVRRLSDPLLGTKTGPERRDGGELVRPSEGDETASLPDQMDRHTRLGKIMDWLAPESEHWMERNRAGTGRIRGIWNGDGRLEPAAEAGEMRGSSGRTDENTWGMGQAEQLDRLFRRDSRRYDGGFFLY